MSCHCYNSKQRIGYIVLLFMLKRNYEHYIKCVYWLIRILMFVISQQCFQLVIVQALDKTKY